LRATFRVQEGCCRSRRPPASDRRLLAVGIWLRCESRRTVFCGAGAPGPRLAPQTEAVTL